MNYILESFPETVVVDGKDYLISFDFRTVLKIHRILSDETFTLQERDALALSFFYPEELPPDHEKARVRMVEFLSREEEKKKKRKKTVTKKDVDFSIDSARIYSGFLKVFHLDLRSEDVQLHWWQFLTLFEEVCLSNTCMRQVINIRNEVIDDSLSAKERAERQRLKDEHSLSTPEEIRRERNKQFDLFVNGGDERDKKKS